MNLEACFAATEAEGEPFAVEGGTRFVLVSGPWRFYVGPGRRREFLWKDLYVFREVEGHVDFDRREKYGLNTAHMALQRSFEFG